MLRLVDANMADDGNYTCVVSNELGTISRTFVVNIVGNIRFLTLPNLLSAQCVSSIGQIIKSVCVSVSQSVSQ